LILMASFDYRLNPLYPIKECSSCGALYATHYCCSKGSLGDKIICDLDNTPNLSQQSHQNCPNCGNPVVGHYCQGCALLRKKFKEDMFKSCVEKGILQDSSEPSDDNTNVVNTLQEAFVVNQDPYKNSSQSPPQINHHCCYGCGNGAHYGYNYPPKVPIVPDLEPFNNQSIKELLPTKIPACYDDDDDEYAIEITHKEPDNSLSMGDEHLDTILNLCLIMILRSFLILRKIDSLFDEFAGELTLLTIPPGINETDYDPDNETRFIKIFLYDNSSPRPPKEFIFENSDTAFESLSPFPILVEDSDSLMEEIDLSFTPDDPMPLGIKEDDYDSERDILILEEFLSNDSLSFPENESFYFDIRSSSRPTAKPPDGNIGISNVKMMGDISEGSYA
nr:hypothetical protein [Tanacetum cinerariifolium]